MFSIYFKEIKGFLSTVAGYVAVLVFLLAAGLFLWVLPDTNMLDYGYATMEQFFTICPWLLLFLIPAVTMRSFADEYKAGTMEWLCAKPISTVHIILGKFFAAFTLVLIALLPTLLYVFSIHWLAVDAATIDMGGLLGAYLGLIALAAAFTAIGVFGSALTENQIVGFLIALFLCFLMYSGFEALSRIAAFRGGADYYLGMIGMDYHYNSMSRGVLDSRDVLYFVSVILFFLSATWVVVKSKSEAR